MMNSFNIIISSKAQSDLAECISFVLNVSKEAARKLANDIYSAIESLKIFPERNAVLNMPKTFHSITRKLIVNKRYIVVYTTEDNNVVIYRIFDARRNFDSLIK